MSEPPIRTPADVREALKAIEGIDAALVERVMRHIQPFKVGDRVRELETIGVEYTENVPEPFPVPSGRQGTVIEKHGTLHVMWDRGPCEGLDRNNTEILNPVDALAGLAE